MKLLPIIASAALGLSVSGVASAQALVQNDAFRYTAVNAPTAQNPSYEDRRMNDRDRTQHSSPHGGWTLHRDLNTPAGSGP
jgi:hypothetical protein